MKKLFMIGATITIMLTMGTAAFAANTGKTDVQVVSRAAGCIFVDADNDGYCDNGDSHCDVCYYVDEDGDSICDNVGRNCTNNTVTAKTGTGRSSCCGNRGNCRR